MKKTLLFMAIAFLASMVQGQVKNGLVAKYSFNNGDATDDIGSIDGTVHGAVLTQDRFGNPNKAYNFNGSSYIALPNASVLKSTSMTVSLWVKVNGYATSTFSNNCIYSVINHKSNAYFGSMYISVVTAGGTYFIATQNKSTESTYGNSNSPQNAAWQHLVVSTNNDSTKFYLDGIKQWSKFKNFTSTYTNDSVYIGATGNTTYSGNLNGAIDDIRVYNRVLNSTEIDSLLKEANPTKSGINYALSNTVKVYPNPTSGILKLSGFYSVKLSDISGKVVLENQNTNLLDISNQANGLYFIVIFDSKGKLISRGKIVKE